MGKSGNGTDAAERRDPMAAMALSLLVVGLGHLYAGRPWRGLALAVGAFAWLLGALWLTTVVPGQAARLGAFLLIAVAPVAVALDAHRVARRAPVPFRPGRLNHPLVYLACAALVVAARPLLLGAMHQVARGYRWPSEGMSPTLLPGDRFFVTPRGRSPLAIGQIVTATRPDGVNTLSRIAGLAGDTLAGRGWVLLRNRRPADGAWTPGRPDDWGPFVVPAGHVFLLGDNRAAAQDSRRYGPIPDSAVTGRLSWIYFSREGLRVRWSRLGTRPD